jgi:chloramphenicol O-acetyltransferase type A
MVRKLDLETWNRRNHFEVFRSYGDPFFNITAEIEVSALRRHVRERDCSFFAASYFLVLKIVNEIEEFRYRIRGNDVVVHDRIHGACTVLNEDRTFSFCFFDYLPRFEDFEKHCAQVFEFNRAKKLLDPRFDRDDVIHSSVIPWVRFTSFEHAKRLGSDDSCPKIVLGKLTEEGGRFVMPISVSGHHALMDGIHAGFFFEKYEQYASTLL